MLRSPDRHLAEGFSNMLAARSRKQGLNRSLHQRGSPRFGRVSICLSRCSNFSGDFEFEKAQARSLTLRSLERTKRHALERGHRQPGNIHRFSHSSLPTHGGIRSGRLYELLLELIPLGLSVVARISSHFAPPQAPSQNREQKGEGRAAWLLLAQREEARNANQIPGTARVPTSLPYLPLISVC